MKSTVPIWLTAFCLTLIFLTLKLADTGLVAKWNWIWVFAPMWIPLGIGATIALWMNAKHAWKKTDKRFYK